MLTFGGHLEVLRKMFFRILGVTGVIAFFVFCFKNTTFTLLLAPSEYDFCTYRWIENLIQTMGINFHFEPYHVDLIATDLSSQFMTHITTSCYLGLLGSITFHYVWIIQVCISCALRKWTQIFRICSLCHLCPFYHWRIDELLHSVSYILPLSWNLQCIRKST